MTLPGIGRKARDMIRGGALLGPIVVQGIDGSGVANRVESEGRLLIRNSLGSEHIASGTASIPGPLTAAKEWGHCQA